MNGKQRRHNPFRSDVFNSMLNAAEQKAARIICSPYLHRTTNAEDFRMALDPQAGEFLKKLAALNAPALHELTLEQARRQAVPISGPIREVARIDNRRIPGPNGEIPVRIYQPADVAATRPAPALVFFHGGGWVICNLDTYDSLCRDLALAADCVVVSVDYRLAPEHKFPAAADDAYAATVWVCDHSNELNIDPNRIAVAGDSAGGNLAAVVSLMARDRGNPAIAFQVLIYPITDYSFDTESYQANSEGYFLTRMIMEWFWEQYLECPEDGTHPYASPLRADDLSNLPPALVTTAGFDPLCDEGRAYAQRLQAAGNDTELVHYEGMIHGYVRRTDLFDRARETVDLIGDRLKKKLN